MKARGLCGIQSAAPYKFVLRIQTQMSPIPLQFVLLIAIATSQIYGGISCCCLTRSIFSPFSNMADDATEGSVSVSPPAGKTACPKCARQPPHQSVASPQSRSNNDGVRTQLCEGSQCRCIKRVSAANSQSQSTGVQSITYSMVAAFTSVLPIFIDQTSLRRFEVPIRFGGNSWQSIICVWNN